MSHIHVHGSSGAMTGLGVYQDRLADALRDLGHEVTETSTRKVEVVVVGKRAGGWVSQQFSTWFQKKAEGADVMHCPSNWTFAAQADSIMVQDVTPLLLRGFESARRMFMRQERRLRKTFLLAPSQATKEALVAWLGVEPDSVHVVPHGVDHEAFYLPGAQADVDPYLLYVGDYRGYKCVAQGIREARRLGVGFMRIGPPARDPGALGTMELGKQLLGDRFMDRGFQTREQLAQAYAEALALWFPSRYEGFGLPPLEAAACGTPSILAETPLMRDLHGDLALYIDDERRLSLEEIQAAKQPVALARHARRYTWRRSAQAHLDAWKRGGLL